MSVQGRERELLRDLSGMHSQAPLWLWACGGGGQGGKGGCRDQPIQTQATSLQHLTTNLAARQRSHSDDKLKDEKIKIKKREQLSS